MQGQISPPFILPDQSVCFFVERAERNQRASDIAGTPQYDRVVVATIKSPGQKESEASYEVVRCNADGARKERHIMARVRPAFEAWEREQTLSDTGMPLELWPAIDVTQVAALKHVNVYTVEQLAQLPDGTLPKTGLGLQAREVRTRAQAYLDAAKGASKFEALAARLEKLEDKGRLDGAELQRLRDENETLRARLGATAPPGAALPADARAPRASRKRGRAETPEAADAAIGAAVEAAFDAQRGGADPGEDEDFI